MVLSYVGLMLFLDGENSSKDFKFRKAKFLRVNGLCC